MLMAELHYIEPGNSELHVGNISHAVSIPRVGEEIKCKAFARFNLPKTLEVTKVSWDFDSQDPSVVNIFLKDPNNKAW